MYQDLNPNSFLHVEEHLLMLFTNFENVERPSEHISPIILITMICTDVAVILHLLSDPTQNHRKFKSLSAFLATLSIIVASIIITGYLYNNPILTRLGGEKYTTASISSSISLLLLGISIIASLGKNVMPLRVFIGDSLFAKLMRGILPIVALGFILQNWLNIYVYPEFSQYPLSGGVIIVYLMLIIGGIISRVSYSVTRDFEKLQRQAFLAEKDLSYMTLKRSLLDASLDPFIAVDKDGKIVDVNKATEEFTTHTRDFLIGSQFDKYFVEEELAARICKNALESNIVENFPLTLKSTSGKNYDVLCNAVAYKDKDGNAIGVFAAARDITKRKSAEESVIKYAATLEKMNRELQQFAYISSHDLQEPLRVITNYLQLIERRFADQVNDELKEYITYVIQSAKRLQNMIDDLLTYTRIDTKESAFNKMNVGTAVKNAMKTLHMEIANTGAIIEYNNLPDICADSAQLSLLFVNLLGNALKFKRKDVTPHIRISANKESNEWVFAVSDNGIGIDLQFKHKLFIIFKRLVGREYPGSGIGLAICNKIVERHGGRIWVESELEKGATFYFTIPIKDE